MTIPERVDQIARDIYMGEIPDAWTLLANKVFIQHLLDVRQEAYEDAAKIAEGPKPYPVDHVECTDGAGMNIASMIRARAKEVSQ